MLLWSIDRRALAFGSTSVPLLERPLCKAFNCGQRSCDRLLPKLAASCDGVRRRDGSSGAKANKHAASALKPGARSLMGEAALAAQGAHQRFEGRLGKLNVWVLVP